MTDSSLPQKKSSFFSPVIVVLILAVVAIISGIAIYKRQQDAKNHAAKQEVLKNTIIAANAQRELEKKEIENLEITEPVVELTQHAEEIQEEEEKYDAAIKNEYSEDRLSKKHVDIRIEQEDPNSAFPTMQSEGEYDEDAEMASAFTYENLQESMLISAKENRDSVKSRQPWSRFGDRKNPQLWKEQMSAMKTEIESSGQTLQEFMDNSLAPIPEQMAAFWRDSKMSEDLPEVSVNRVEKLSRFALSEAPSLTKDAMQDIGSTNEFRAASRLTEVLNSRKRAKVLGLVMPALTSSQINDAIYWQNSNNKNISHVAAAVINFN